MTEPVRTEKTTKSSFFANLTEQFQPQKLFPSLSAGLVTGIIAVIRGISYAALIFSGSLSNYLSIGVGMAIFSNAAMGIVVALLAPFPGIIATPLAAPTAVLAALASVIATQMSGSPAQDIVLTVVCAIVISTILAGLLLLLLGRFKLGNSIQLIPHPVIGGFMGGTGLILLQGSLQVMTNVEFSSSQIFKYLQPEVLPNWIAGVICALILLVVSERYKHFLVIPGTLLALIGIFYLGFLLTNTSFTEAKAQNWLLSFSVDGQLWQPLMPAQFDHIHWLVIFQNWEAIASLIFICVLELVLTKNGIESFVRQDIDLNRTLESVGFANLVAGFGSGMAGNQALPSTILVSKMEASRRLTGVICALVSVAVLFLGPSFLSFFPRAVIGALSFYLGLSLIIKWVYNTWFQLDLSEYLVIIASLIVIVTVGFLEGIAVGFAAELVFFLYNYAQRDIIKDDFDEIEAKNQVFSSSSRGYLLPELAKPIQLWQLQGYIFFGTANRLIKKFRQLLDTEEKLSLSYLIIDCSQLEGIDSSGVLTLAKIVQLASQQRITIVYTNLTSSLENKLDRGKALDINNEYCKCFPDQKQGIQWCQNQVLDEVSLEQSAY